MKTRWIARTGMALLTLGLIAFCGACNEEPESSKSYRSSEARQEVSTDSEAAASEIASQEQEGDSSPVNDEVAPFEDEANGTKTIEEGDKAPDGSQEKATDEDPFLQPDGQRGGYDFAGRWVREVDFSFLACLINQYYSNRTYAAACVAAGHVVKNTTCYGPVCSKKLDKVYPYEPGPTPVPCSGIVCNPLDKGYGFPDEPWNQ